MTLRRAEIKRVDIIRTHIVELPIPTPLMALVVTASVGHIPSIRTSVGFSLMTPLTIRSRGLFILHTSFQLRKLDAINWSAPATASWIALVVKVAPAIPSIWSAEVMPGN